MKKALLSVFAFAFITIQTCMAQASGPVADAGKTEDKSGLFIGAEGGGFWLRTASPSAGPMSVDISFKSGSAWEIPLGYDFGNGLQIGLSVGQYKSDLDTIVGNYQGSSQEIALHATDKGSATFIPVMANVSYSLPLVGGLHWNIGVGAGVVHGKLDFAAYDFADTQANIFGQLGSVGTHPIVNFNGLTSSAWNFGFQAFTGLSYEFTDNFSIEVSYRYIQLGTKLSISGGSGSEIEGLTGGSTTLRGQSVQAGISWKF